MIKKIKTSSVRLGMYIHDFGEGSHSITFRKPPFLLENNSTLLRLRVSNLQHILIDTDKGLDVLLPVAESRKIKPPKPLPASSAPSVKQARFEKKLSAQEELQVAKNIVKQANIIIKSVMTDIRIGKQIEVTTLEPLAENIMRSVMRNKDALVSLTRMKNKDDYTFMHSVSVAGLMIVLAKANGMSENAIYEVALGGLLHDIGKMITPNEILNKPGALTDEEFYIMRNHVKESEALLRDKLNLSKNTLDVIFQHHEKVDGTGYPYGLKNGKLSEVGKMSAIVDVYDALTSKRVYKSAWEPAFTLKKMMQWTEFHLDKTQLFNFIHCLGVYPVGSFVEMESGRVGMVIDQHESDITKPLVKFFYRKGKGVTKVEIIDLSLEKEDRVITPIYPEKYGIDMRSVLTMD